MTVDVEKFKTAFRVDGESEGDLIKGYLSAADLAPSNQYKVKILLVTNLNT